MLYRLIENNFSYLSLDHSSSVADNEPLTFQGLVWNQELSKFGVKHTEVIVQPSALNRVKVYSGKYMIGEMMKLESSIRELPLNDLTISRLSLIAENGRTVLSVTDDLNPVVVIGSVLAGAAVTICTTATIYNIIYCEDNFET